MTLQSSLVLLGRDRFYLSGYVTRRARIVLDRFAACWEGLEDPRTENAALHDFHELLMIALCTVLSGGQGAVDMARFAASKETFLRGFLKLEHGLPSHDTFSRLFRLLDPEQFGAAFQRFMASFAKTIQGVVAIDGKVLRRSFNRASGKSVLYMVSAWGCEQRLVLAQVTYDEAATFVKDAGGTIERIGKVEASDTEA